MADFKNLLPTAAELSQLEIACPLLLQIAPKTFNGIVFRNVGLNYDPLTDRASFNIGGRWNKEQMYGALYSSIDRETCIEETKRVFERRGLDFKKSNPREIVSLKVSMKKVLDLTDAENLSLLGISEKNITSDDYTLPQVISDAARKLGYEAIISPSATGKGKNLNIYLDMKHENSVIEIVKREIIEMSAI